MAEARYLDSPLSPQGDNYFKVTSPPGFLNGVRGKLDNPSVYGLNGDEISNLVTQKQDNEERSQEVSQEIHESFVRVQEENDTGQEEEGSNLEMPHEQRESPFTFSLQGQSEVRQEHNENSSEVSHDHENLLSLPEQSGSSPRHKRGVETSEEKDSESLSGSQEQVIISQLEVQDERTQDVSQETAETNVLSVQEGENNGVSLVIPQELEQENSSSDGQELESCNIPSIPGLENTRLDDNGPGIHTTENYEVSDLDNPSEHRSDLNFEEQEDLGVGGSVERGDPSFYDQENEDLDDLQERSSVLSIEDLDDRGVDIQQDQDDTSDIIIEDDNYPSRSSSPEIEVLEVRKSTIQYTVDLTGDDDDDDQMDVDPVVCDTVRPEHRSSPFREPQGSSAPLLDISSEDTLPPTSSRTQQEPQQPVVSSSFTQSSSSSFTNDVQSGSSLSQPHTSGNTSFDGHWKKSMASGYGIKQESDALSMMLELESYVSQNRSSQHSSSSYDTNSYYPIQSDFYKYPSASASTKCTSAGSNSSNSLSTGYTSGSSRCGTSQMGNSLYDSPLDMTLPEGRAVKKEPGTFNSYGGPPSSVPFVESSSQSSSGLQLDGVAYDIIDLALKKTGLTSSDFKTPIPSHPNSAFQAVTPSTSGAVVADPMEFLNRPNVPAAANEMSSSGHTWNESLVSYTSSQSAGNPGNSFLNSSVGSGASTSQVIDSPMQSFLNILTTGSSPSYNSNSSNSNVGVRISQNSSSGITSNNFQSSYGAGPSTSTGSSSQGGSSAVAELNYSNEQQQSSHLSSLIFVLPPSTRGEQASSFTTISQQSTNSSVTSSSAVTVVASGSGRTSDSERSLTSASSTYDNPPSPGELTFSCTICLDSVKTIKSSSRNLCSTVCGHVFCSACLQASLKRKKECPMCRKKLGKKQYHPLFI